MRLIKASFKIHQKFTDVKKNYFHALTSSQKENSRTGKQIKETIAEIYLI